MAVTIRELPPEEYKKLEGHEFLHELGVPSPGCSRILVGEDGGSIVAFWMLVAVPHLEPIWIDPKYRRSMLAGRLWKAMQRVIDALPLSGVISNITDPIVGGYLERLGFKPMDYKVYMYSVEQDKH
jgi:hypothetical protein